MKKIFLILLGLVATLTIVSGQVTVTSSTGLLAEPSPSSRRIATAIEGQAIQLLEQSGSSWKVTLGKKTGLIHASCLSNYDHSKTTTNTATREPVNPVQPSLGPDSLDYSQYGGIFSVGLALGGGGLVGVPLRLFLTRNLALELGGYLRGMLSGGDLLAGLNINGGFNAYLKDSYNPAKKKIRHDGLFIRGGGTLINPDVTDYIFMAGWTRDHFKAGIGNKAFTLELGAGLNYSKYTKTESGSWGWETTTYTGTTPMLFWKFSWCIFPAKK